MTNNPLLWVGSGLIEWVDLFPYLGSVIVVGESIDVAVDRRIANTYIGTFRALRQSRSVFDDCHFSIKTKTCAYQACVLSTLLYGSKC